jgi:hypothetical protein
MFSIVFLFMMFHFEFILGLSITLLRSAMQRCQSKVVLYVRILRGVTAQRCRSSLAPTLARNVVE